MNPYVTLEGKRIGAAWSVQKCGARNEHGPHIHNPHYACFGPYCCPGFPAKKIVEGKVI